MAILYISAPRLISLAVGTMFSSAREWGETWRFAVLTINSGISGYPVHLAQFIQGPWQSRFWHQLRCWRSGKFARFVLCGHAYRPGAEGWGTTRVFSLTTKAHNFQFLGLRVRERMPQGPLPFAADSMFLLLPLFLLLLLLLPLRITTTTVTTIATLHSYCFYYYYSTHEQ